MSRETAMRNSAVLLLMNRVLTGLFVFVTTLLLTLTL